MPSCKSKITSLLNHFIIAKSKQMEVIRFGITGGIAVSVQYGCYLLLLYLIKLNAPLSSIMSYLISFCLNFYLSSKFTFRSKPRKKTAVLFALSHLINMTLQSILVIIFSLLIIPQYSLLPALCICFPINYVLVRNALLSN